MRNAILERLASATVYPLADVKLLSPIANPGKIVCAPLNYDFHVAEAKSDSGINFGTAITDSKSIGAFLKASSALVGPSQGVAIRFPDQCTRSEEHTSELQSLMRISYAVFCLKKKKNNPSLHITHETIQN